MSIDGSLPPRAREIDGSESTVVNADSSSDSSDFDTDNNRLIRQSTSLSSAVNYPAEGRDYDLHRKLAPLLKNLREKEEDITDLIKDITRQEKKLENSENDESENSRITKKIAKLNKALNALFSEYEDCAIKISGRSNANLSEGQTNLMSPATLTLKTKFAAVWEHQQETSKASWFKQPWNLSAGATTVILSFVIGNTIVKATDLPFLLPVIVPLLHSVLAVPIGGMMRSTTWTGPTNIGLKVVTDHLPFFIFTDSYFIKNMAQEIVPGIYNHTTPTGMLTDLGAHAVAGTSAGALYVTLSQLLRELVHPQSGGKEEVTKIMSVWALEFDYLASYADDLNKEIKKISKAGHRNGELPELKKELAKVRADMNKAKAKSQFLTSIAFELGINWRGEKPGVDGNPDVPAKYPTSVAEMAGKFISLWPTVVATYLCNAYLKDHKNDLARIAGILIPSFALIAPPGWLMRDWYKEKIMQVFSVCKKKEAEQPEKSEIKDESSTTTTNSQHLLTTTTTNPQRTPTTTTSQTVTTQQNDDVGAHEELSDIVVQVDPEESSSDNEYSSFNSEDSDSDDEGDNSNSIGKGEEKS